MFSASILRGHIGPGGSALLRACGLAPAVRSCTCPCPLPLGSESVLGPTWSCYEGFAFGRRKWG
eukprot:15444192-Alexandrium_andersonii.AAC.2